jgi:hypothetical protein
MSGSLRGVPVLRDPIWLRPKLPAEIVAYQVAIVPSDAAVLANLSAAAAPSGTGELAVEAVQFGGGNATLTLAAGQPSRFYTILLTANRADGLVSDYVLNMTMGAVLPTDQAGAPPSAGFGAAATWTYTPSLNFSVPRNSMLLL